MIFRPISTAMGHPITEQKISDLLTYLPDYGVLLCRSCQFAVQPSAFSSHLLRHQIYRNERRKLLERLHTLVVAEPEDVDVPPSTSPPIPGLPVYRGSVCSAPDCSHCCVSEKRMAQHWSLVHHKPNAQDVEARPAYLQTFFRGNKNRYFEVSATSSILTPAGSEDPSSPMSQSSESKDILKDFRKQSTPIPHPRSFSIGSRSDGESHKVPHLDMTSLKLLYYWQTNTCATVSRGTESPSFWAHEVTQDAFKHEFLMQGILGVTAYHLMRNTPEAAARAELRETGLRLVGDGLSQYRRVLRKAPTTENATAVIAFGRLLGVQRCAESQLNPVDGSHKDESAVAPLLEAFFMLRGSIQLLVQCQHLLPEGSQLRLPSYIVNGMESCTWQQRLELQKMSGQDSMFLPPMAWFPHLPPDIYEQILTIPLKLTLFTPDTNPGAMETIDDASLALLNAFNRSYESEELWALWNGVESWSYALPDALADEFINMVRARNPGILFMYAHWCLLVRRVEPHFWFLEGQSHMLLKIILANLDGEPARIVREFLQA